MRHVSIKLDYPAEFINIKPVNPLISKCQIKVCYVSDEPNRNGSIITKDTAREMANSLPGSPIVGFYNEYKKDFEEHNREIKISNGMVEMIDTTRPYGFVDLNARVWFQKFLDDNEVEREYLMTEGWLWTGQYPECKRILTSGNNQSMELDEEHLKAEWSKDDNGFPEFFIINEAIISKLCILGEDNEPCFEGANITNVQFSLGEDFKQQLFSMIQELTEVLKEEKGGANMANRYAVTIGDSLWTALYSYIKDKYSEAEKPLYSIIEVCENDGQKFAILKNEDKYYSLDFSFDEEKGFSAEEDLKELVDYKESEDPQFSLEEIQNFEGNFQKKNNQQNDKSKKGENDEDICPECGKPLTECACGGGKKKKKYDLEEVEEYQALKVDFDELNNNYTAATQRVADLEEQVNSLTTELNTLKEFKNGIEKEKKQEMIDSFYMLSDEDKKDVLENIDTYSLDDIEAKLSIICVRNKVSFNLDNEVDPPAGPTTFNLDDPADDTTPAWVKAALQTAQNM